MHTHAARTRHNPTLCVFAERAPERAVVPLPACVWALLMVSVFDLTLCSCRSSSREGGARNGVAQPAEHSGLTEDWCRWSE